ncbi:hypothetical protein TNCV_4994311 [Trichonephila clavipes]|nr:hypothetical protein TNCV_4994311 [Trichonephila clavipes]
MGNLQASNPLSTHRTPLDLQPSKASTFNSTRILKLQYIHIPNLHNRVFFLSWLERNAILAPKISQENFSRKRDKAPSQPFLPKSNFSEIEETRRKGRPPR